MDNQYYYWFTFRRVASKASIADLEKRMKSVTSDQPNTSTSSSASDPKYDA